MADALEKWKNLIQSLLPKGKFWESLSEGDLPKLLEGAAVEFCRVEERVKKLEKEMFPGSAVELLPEWENLLGLPDECSPENATISDRQIQANLRFTMQGGISKEFLETLAVNLGFPEVIVERVKPFQVGRSRVGQPLTNFTQDVPRFRVGQSRVGDRLLGSTWEGYFILKIPIGSVTQFRVGQSRVGDPLRLFENEFLQCTFRKFKPARAGIFFQFLEN